MPVARAIVLVGCLGLTLAVSAAGAAPEGAASDEPRGGYGHLKPLVMEADKLAPPAGKRPEGDRPAHGDAGPPPAVRVDPKTRTVRVPVRVTRAGGVVEWLLSAGVAHTRTSVLVTRCPVRAVARALEQVGLAEGRPPEPVGDDAARPPQGPAVRLTLRFRGADGAPTRLPAEKLLAAASDGTPLPRGRWVYVGPQTLADGKVLLAELSGSLVTTGLRDTSAMIYWVPASSREAPLYVKAFYGRPEVVPAEAREAVLEIRPVAAKSKPAK